MARILLLTPQLPYPPIQGTSLRNWHIIRGLADARHDLSLLSFADEGSEMASDPLARTCRIVETVPTAARNSRQRLIRLATTDRPDLALRLDNRTFDSALGRLLQTETYDIVQIEGLELARVIPLIRQAAPNGAVILDCHNAETELQRRAFKTDVAHPARWPAAIYSRLQIGRLARFERWACSQSDAVICVSEPDRRQLMALAPALKRPIAIIPNSIDTTEYQPTAEDLSEGQRFDLIFSGKMDYRPNVDATLWFAEKVWPALRRVKPELTWAIVGQKPHPRLDRLRGRPGITLTGQVERIQPYLAGAMVYIMPLRIGSGTRLKLIEAMAAGKAVVSTTLGAEGFPVQDGRDLLLAETPEDMIREIQRLLDDPQTRRRIEQAAQSFAADYDWRKVAPLFRQVYNSVLSGPADFDGVTLPAT